MWCPEISFPRILCIGLVPYPEEVYGIVSHLIISMSFYITFKKKILACGWVTRGSYMGHIRIALWVSGSTNVIHFQPWMRSLVAILPSFPALTDLSQGYLCFLFLILNANHHSFWNGSEIVLVLEYQVNPKNLIY